jgi:hypothetical protein
MVTHVPVAMRVIGTLRIAAGDCAVMMGCGAEAGCAAGGVVAVGPWSVDVPSAGLHIRRTAFSQRLLQVR